MRRRLPWILLALSLAANVFFAAGVLYTMYTKERLSESPERRIEYVADRLDLTDEQRAGLLELRERTRERFREFRADRAEMRAAFLEELAKPEFDRARVQALIDARAAQRGPVFLGMAEDLHGFLASLDPAQRESFLEMARERGFLRGIFGSGRRGRSKEG